jgi:hypothetical protein
VESQAEYDPFPLKALLYLYETGSSYDLCANYMEGFKLLVQWLQPIEQAQMLQKTKIPKLLGNYESREIAKILAIDEHILLMKYIIWLKYITQITQT